MSDAARLRLPSRQRALVCWDEPRAPAMRSPGQQCLRRRLQHHASLGEGLLRVFQIFQDQPTLRGISRAREPHDRARGDGVGVRDESVELRMSPPAADALERFGVLEAWLRGDRSVDYAAERRAYAVLAVTSRMSDVAAA